jgi:hypothetical protein
MLLGENRELKDSAPAGGSVDCANEIARCRFVIEVQFDITSSELTHYCFNPLFDRRMVCAVARNKLLHDGSQGQGR